MKKMLVLLMVLAIAAPTMALTVKAYDKGNGVVDINYVKLAGEQRVRGFGLDITVVSPATVAVKANPGSFKTGVSTAASRGYGIFPGTIDINSVTGVVNGYGTPAAKVGSPGAGTGNVVTIELGSLYSPAGDANAPIAAASAGEIKLCSLQVTQNGATSPVALTIALNATRGGIVLEDANAAVSPTLTGTSVAFGAAPTCWDVTQCGGQLFGDSTCDGKVNLADLAAMKASFNKNKGTAGYNCCADFNHDTKVNLADLAIMKAHFNITTYTPKNLVQSCPP